MISVLFLCTHNSARSIMAEAMLKHKAPDLFTVHSAGTEPSEPDPRAIAALRARGIDAGEPRSESVDDYMTQQFDYVISLCAEASSSCAMIGIGDTFLPWKFPDPKSRDGDTPFETTLDEIEVAMDDFIAQCREKHTPGTPA